MNYHKFISKGVTDYNVQTPWFASSFEDCQRLFQEDCYVEYCEQLLAEEVIK